MRKLIYFLNTYYKICINILNFNFIINDINILQKEESEKNNNSFFKFGKLFNTQLKFFVGGLCFSI